MRSPDPRRVQHASVVMLAFLVWACGSSTTTSAPSQAASDPSAPSPAAVTPESSPATAPPDAGRPSFDPSAVSLETEVVVNGLDQPVEVATPGDGSGRLFVAEQAGLIRTIEDGELLDQPFMDIRERITSGGERGLLGLAFHPEFPTEPRFFVNYTDVNGDTIVAEYRLSPDGTSGDAGSERILVQIDQPYANHNGGAVVFGPDGMLYVATGDGGSGGDPHDNGRRLDTLLAKILRIDVNAPAEDGSPYGIPPDNPFVDNAEARPEIWLTGLRNPWRIRFDDRTGDLWIGDVGQGAWEEIDVTPSGTGGLDFGWNVLEGFECFDPPSDCDQTGLSLPVAAYGHAFGCAVIGGVVVRDPDQPLLDGGYLFSDSCSGNLWLLDAAVHERQEPTLVEETGRSISTIALAEDGTVLATDRTAGELVRIVAGSR